MVRAPRGAASGHPPTSQLPISLNMPRRTSSGFFFFFLSVAAQPNAAVHSHFSNLQGQDVMEAARASTIYMQHAWCCLG